MLDSKNQSRTLTLIKVFLFFVAIFLFNQACTKKEGSFLTELPAEAEQPMIVLISANGSHRGVTAYDINGQFLKIITDFRLTGGTPRSIIHLSGTDFLVGQENPDKIDNLNLDGEISTFHGSNYFSGNIYGAVKDSSGNIYSIETSNIEKFNSVGVRQPFTTGNAFIQGNADGCSLSNPRKLFMTSNNHLIVVNYSSGNITTFDVSTETVTCLSQVNVGTQLYAVLLHSNGSLYYARWSTDSIYRADPDGSNSNIVWASNTAIINNPSDLEELPNGNILVASYSNHRVEEIDQDGNRVGTQPFIIDGQTLNVFDIVITPGEDP